MVSQQARAENCAKMDDDGSQLGILIMTREHCGGCMSSTFFGQRPLFASLDMLTPIFLAFGWRVTLALSGEYIGFFCMHLIEFFSLGDFLSALDESSDLKQF